MSIVFGYVGSPDERLLPAMASVMQHRGRDPVYNQQHHHTHAGYMDLLNEANRQRCRCGVHQDGDLTISVAGQVFLNNPAQDLISLYKQKGIDFVEDLSGAFVLAIQDGRTLHLVRDGAGARTVYYAKHAGRFLFSCEPKGIWSLPDFPRKVRPGAVAQYLTFSFVPGAATMLADIEELPAGFCLTVHEGCRVELNRYFHFESAEPEEQPPPSEDEAWIKRFHETFAQAVSDRIPVNEPFVVYLSGGIDSSVVAAELKRLTDKPIRSFAIHFGKKYPNELDFARAVAEQVGTDHEEVLMEPRDFLPRLRQMVWHLDEPIGDPITMPNFELSRRVSQESRWVFNGEGGDPLFGGPKNLPMLLQHWYGGIERDPLFRERAYLASYRRAYEEVDLMLSPEFRSQFDRTEALECVMTPFFDCRKPSLFVNKMTAANIRLKGAHLILPKVERMLGAWGITPLSPLFDDRLITLSFRMPTRLKLDRGIEKVVLKRAYSDLLPQSVIDRPKSGMRVPVHFWFQGEMKRYARKILHPSRIKERGIFDAERVKQLLSYETEEGRGRYGLRLWMLITFEIWRRMVEDGEAI